MNLSLVTMIYITTLSSYYLLLTLTNTFSNIYVSAMVSSAAQFIGYMISGMIVNYLGFKRSLTISFAMSAFGGTMIAAWGVNNMDSPWF